MAGRGEPPEGTPEGLPGGGEDEYRSVVFDESFVRAARLQEFSAQERMREHARAVRSRSSWSFRPFTKQIVALAVLLFIAFGTAVYMGLRHPYQPGGGSVTAEPLRMTVIPLAPQTVVPGIDVARLFDHSPAAQFRTGADGINLPAVRRTAHFSESQIIAGVTTAKEYLVQSSLDPQVLTGKSVHQVRALLDPELVTQFDQSIDNPADDGRHAATGWLVRFDPAKVALADTEVRVQGTFRYAESGRDTLDVTSDHTFTYALRPAASGQDKAASLFTVRRELHFRFDRDDLRLHRVELQFSYVEAGPQACSADVSAQLRPLLAGERTSATGPAGTDPYATGPATAALCGTLATSAQPTP